MAPYPSSTAATNGSARNYFKLSYKNLHSSTSTSSSSSSSLGESLSNSADTDYHYSISRYMSDPTNVNPEYAYYTVEEAIESHRYDMGQYCQVFDDAFYQKQIPRQLSAMND